MGENKFKIVFAGGGTGGHIYPGLAVCDALYKKARENGFELEIYWIGSSSGMDRTIVEKNLVSLGGSVNAFYGISCGKLRRYFSLKNFIDLFKILFGYFQSVHFLKKIKCDFLFSKGGFVSVPPCRAAALLKIPYVTHECDFTPGLATRLNAGKAKNILLTYKDTSGYLKESLRSKCIVTGNPVRPVFYEDLQEKGLEFLSIKKGHAKPVLLVLGGSLGARQINTLVLENLDWLKEHFIVVHQTGASFAEENKAVMASGDESYKPYAFIYSEMPGVIMASDVVLSRSGANSLWECLVCRKPMVLVPLCGSGSRGDQVDNARYVESKGACITLVGKDADSEHLRNSLSLMLSEEKRKSFSASCENLSRGEKPAFKIAELILEYKK